MIRKPGLNTNFRHRLGQTHTHFNIESLSKYRGPKQKRAAGLGVIKNNVGRAPAKLVVVLSDWQKGFKHKGIYFADKGLEFLIRLKMARGALVDI